MAQKYYYPVNQVDFGPIESPVLIKPHECIPGKAYWGEARGMGSVAIHDGLINGDLAFQGLVSDGFGDSLLHELHFDTRFKRGDTIERGTFLPFVELIDQPTTNEDWMEWLRDVEHEILTDRLAWLMKMPEGYAPQELREKDLEQTKKRLGELEKMRQHGFSDKAIIFGRI